MAARSFEIVAQDPHVLDTRRRVLTATINLPDEVLLPGPLGYALHVVDYDASTGTMYQAYTAADGDVGAPTSTKALLADPGYHAMNAYAIAMRTLLRFEFALGRRVGWGIHGHQLKIVPHAFEGANAFYSPDLEALLFGYVRDKKPMFLCLSHDVVAHETAHALLDGLRDKFMAPSSADQAALHEAFADIVALLSVFSLPEVVRHLISPIEGDDTPRGFAHKSALSWEWLTGTALFGLADGMRTDGADVRANALRRSVDTKPDRHILERLEFQEEHRRGEVLVAAVMRAFVKAWVARIQRLGGAKADTLVDLGLAAEQGADIADLLLTMTIRAIDYTPPIHIEFPDFLTAMLTADTEVRADDTRYHLRDHLRQAMLDYGIAPRPGEVDGCWPRPTEDLTRGRAHFVSLQSDPTEMFRHVWNNRRALELDENAFTRIASIRPCMRVSPDDGFQIRETVVECVQWLKVTGAELHDIYGLTRPRGMPADHEVVLEAGSTLVLDEYGVLKFKVSNPLPSSPATKTRWNSRIKYLWDKGYFSGPSRSSQLASLHLERTLIETKDLARQRRRELKEAWH